MLNTSTQDPGAENGKFQALKSSFRRLISLYIESAKLTAAEKLTLLLSAAVLFMIAFILVTIAIAFGAVALLQLLELALSPIAAAAILAGFFFLLAAVICLLRKPLIINPTARFMSKLIMDIGKDRIKY
ncbi:MAG: phage holin family protein [Muribaculaceae bacterium]|nr:phage holin family protein [Muribaculaceae bacterium]MDE6360659.1 phage holin family protein [Muribaculaceae bacterium]